MVIELEGKHPAKLLHKCLAWLRTCTNGLLGASIVSAKEVSIILKGGRTDETPFWVSRSTWNAVLNHCQMTRTIDPDYPGLSPSTPCGDVPRESSRTDDLGNSPHRH